MSAEKEYKRLRAESNAYEYEMFGMSPRSSTWQKLAAKKKAVDDELARLDREREEKAYGVV